jgi:hypothetical protein
MRYRALKQTGAKECIAKIVKGLTPEQKREFIVKDNSSFGEWDMDLLSGWDDLPLVDWGVNIPKHWGEAPLMAKNFEAGKGQDDPDEEGGSQQDKYPVTFILDQSEWEAWVMVKYRLKLRDDKAAFLKMIGGEGNA